MIVIIFWTVYVVAAFAGPPTVMRMLLQDHGKRGDFAEIGTAIYIFVLLLVGAVLNAGAILVAFITFVVGTLLWIASLRYNWDLENP
ncbi:hypothetical protein [Sinorhizobium meliloti]|uniref:hypothetical protein n=1 Tax=Rhizobium meliloti TaxID=382 RepID=UPI001F48FA13|nr:hypothetical protein [Sinorhizobium meliloti]